MMGPTSAYFACRDKTHLKRPFLKPIPDSMELLHVVFFLPTELASGDVDPEGE